MLVIVHCLVITTLLKFFFNFKTMLLIYVGRGDEWQKMISIEQKSQHQPNIEEKSVPYTKTLTPSTKHTEISQKHTFY